MKYCNNCNKPLINKNEDFEGLCANCYKDYWFKKIDEMFVESPAEDEPKENFFTRLINFFKGK